MREEVIASLAEYDGRSPPAGPAFIIAADGSRVITYLGASGWINGSDNGIVVRAAGSQATERAA